MNIGRSEYEALKKEITTLRAELAALKDVAKSVLSWDYAKLITEDHIDGDGLCRSLDALATLVREE